MTQKYLIVLLSLLLFNHFVFGQPAESEKQVPSDSPQSSILSIRSDRNETIDFQGMLSGVSASLLEESEPVSAGDGNPATIDVKILQQSEVFGFNRQKFRMMHAAGPQEEEAGGPKEKSGVRAAFLSALLPGAGEAYAGSWWRSALFVGLEIAFWSANVYYDNKGDKEDNRMREYGLEHWDEQKYWSKVYAEAVKMDLWDKQTLDVVKVEVQTNGNKYEYERIADDDYTQYKDDLRRMESKLNYTHSLPESNTHQQYYEMIYKYLHQFGVGWDDAPGFDFYDNTANILHVTPHIGTYRDMRNRSNDYYDTATTMVSLVLLNHLVSAFDAAIAVKQYNKKIRYSFNIDRRYYGVNEPVYTYGVKVSW